MAEIELGGNAGVGLYALVDDEDYKYLSQFKWHISVGYAMRNSSAGKHGKRHLISMHREVLGVGPDLEVDHINHNRLDNRSSNLRVATRAQNGRNRLRQSNNTSGYKGVRKHRNGWQAIIKVDGATICLGTFRAPEEAAIAYDDAARYYYGEFASPNFSESQYAD